MTRGTVWQCPFIMINMYVASFLELPQPPSMYVSRFNSVRTGCMVLYYINFICNHQSRGIFYHHYTTYLLLVSEYRILLFSYLILNILASKWPQIKNQLQSLISRQLQLFYRTLHPRSFKFIKNLNLKIEYS